MKVVLLDHTQNPEQVVATSGRLCYSQSDVDDLYHNATPLKNQEILHKLLDSGHLSTLEHVKFTFGISGVSRVLTHQLVRHRIASYSQQSQRYVKNAGDYIIPPSIANHPDLLEEFQACIHKAHETYQSLTAKGVPQEDARYALANAVETKIIVTMNARQLYHFFALRCCTRAQWEIRALANQMLRLCTDVAPALFEKAGAACVSGVCPEGAMTCGQLRKIRETQKH